MRKITFAIAGMGNRGTKYASKQFKFPDEMEVVAIADRRRKRLDAANKYLHLPESMIFDSAEEMIAQPKLADVMVIATQDAQHKAHALAALKKGYDLLLEKPISNSPEDCMSIALEAKKAGRRVIVCHVLRYTVFYQEIKKIIDSGVLGKIESVEMAEHVGYYHIAHSYVRGNWHKASASSPMILAKCCHDMDLILWLTGKKCLKVNSFGSLDHFRRENCPPGAPERCTDGCPAKCPFNAVDFYISRIPGWPANVLDPEPTKENIMDALRTTDYGRCVYRMDNDVVDHQTVQMLLEDGVTVSFQMLGFTADMTRTIRLFGTEGELWGDFRSLDLHWQRFGEEAVNVDLASRGLETDGHGGGDARLVYDVIRFLRGDSFDTSSITSVDRSVESHYVAFAAEESRVKGGELILMDDFIKNRVENKAKA